MRERNVLECMTLVGSSPSPYDGEKAYVSTGAVDCDHIVYEDIEMVSFGQRPSRANLVAATGDILFAKMCGTKKTLRVSKQLSEYLYSTGFYAVRANEDVIVPDLLYHLLTSEQFLKQKDLNSSGATQKAITNEGLKKIHITIPHKAVQQNIAKQLNCIVGLIELQNKQLSYLEQLVKSRFIELFGDPVVGTSKWPIHSVGAVADAIDPQPSHRTPPVELDGIPYVSIKDCDLRSGEINFEGARRVSPKILDEHLKRYNLHDGDFIIGKIGTIGKPIFVPTRRDYTLSANVVLVQPKQSVVRPYFLKYAFESEFIDRQFSEAKNSTSQAAFGIQKVRTVQVMNPDLKVQDKFELLAKQVDKSKYYSRKCIKACQRIAAILKQEWMLFLHKVIPGGYA